MIVPSRYLGDTRAGKRICTYMTADQSYIRQQIGDFDTKDHFDAYCLFQWLMVNAFRTFGESSEEVKDAVLMGTIHESLLDPVFVSSEKKRLSLLTSIDVAAYGKRLVKDFLID